MSELEAMATTYIVEQTNPDLVNIMEFFDDISLEDARAVYDLILTANVDVSWE